MSDTIKTVKGVMTVDGVVLVDYNSLANLPTIDGTVIEGSTNAVQGAAVYTALEGKLDAKDGKAADSILFGGQAPEYYATAESVQSLTEEVNNNITEAISEINTQIETILDTKLDKTAQAVDSAKLGGQDPSYYATKTEVNDAQLTADNALSTANQAMLNLCGCWIDFTDENGDPTDEPYIHWYVEEE